jgi:hypothetical protein
MAGAKPDQTNDCMKNLKKNRNRIADTGKART